MASTWRSRGRSGHCTREWICWCDIRAACPKLLQGRPVQFSRACVAMLDMRAQKETPAKSPSRYLYLTRANSRGGMNREKLHLFACSQALQSSASDTQHYYLHTPTYYVLLITTSYYSNYCFLLDYLLLLLRTTTITITTSMTSTRTATPQLPLPIRQ